METNISNELMDASQLAKRLVASLLIEQIYFSKIQIQGAQVPELIILLPSSNTQHLTEARALIGTILSSQRSFRYRTFYFHEVKEGLKRGSIVFFSICQPEQLIYIRPDSNVPLFNNKVTFEKVYSRAKVEQEKENKKISSFRQGMNFYYGRGDNELCALMLHQVFELCYRLAEINLIGKEKISHSLRTHHKFLFDFIPELHTIFDAHSEREMTQLENLNEAYIRARYENSYEIARSDLIELMGKSVQLERMIKTYSALVHAQFEERFAKEEFQIETEHTSISPAAEPKSKSEPIPAGKKLSFLQVAVARITAAVDTHSIYQLCRSRLTADLELPFADEHAGKNSSHYYLLVITHKEVEGSIYGLQNEINDASKMGDRLVLLFHTFKAVEKSIREGEPFFIQRLVRAVILFMARDASEIQVIEQAEDMDGSYLVRKNARWTKRLVKITALKLQVQRMDDEAAICSYVFSLLCEQVCLSFIEVLLDYRPTHNGLMHLLDICSLTDANVYAFFPNTTEQDNRLFKELSNGLSNFRFRLASEISAEEAKIIRERVERFASFVLGEISSYLKENPPVFPLSCELGYL
ncbi:HEPN domain-containing protein [Sphingobacterium deserti]|uniref:HEPN domain-containing protein n=1 Tax=Sphingobacterium deserti TaxID=1229276 RepID=A0A0B8T6Q1_9SPHI|nr:HEPN domain-containing protein [Sphingobacterium deserti]KGE13789.1 hypothetical protein DI53_2415 [Sphingobacterium deserti]